jgi:hypothetical protein
MNTFTTADITTISESKKKMCMEKLTNKWIALALDKETIALVIARLYASEITHNERIYLITHLADDNDTLFRGDYNQILKGVKHDSLGKKSISEYLQELLPSPDEKRPTCLWSFRSYDNCYNVTLADDRVIKRFEVYLKYEDTASVGCVLL